MRLAVDTNIFIALFSGDEEGTVRVQHALEEAAAERMLKVSPVVHAELLAVERFPEVTDEFFFSKGIEIDWEAGEEVWRTAGIRYGRYARDRRQRPQDPGPRRILADFLVGAHALHLGDRRLLTTDTSIFSSYFPEVEIVSP